MSTFHAPPLATASAEGATAVVRRLLDDGADVQETWKGNSALHRALQYGHDSIVQLLIEKGAHVNLERIGGQSSLHLAITGKCSDATVQLLLDKGAAVNAMNRQKETPLHYAILEGRDQVVDMLLEKGADVSLTTKIGCTALHYAVAEGRDAIVEVLLGKGSDVNLKTTDVYGDTPLHLAVDASWSGNYVIVKMLLDRGADVCARNSSGRTPENLASSLRYQEGMDDIVTLLRAEAERRAAEAERRASCEAFAMLDHERLGAQSLGRRLDAGVVRMIMDLVW